MKLVLASSPEGKKKITKKIIELVGKPAKDISICVISEAQSVKTGDRRWFINGLHKVSKTFGGDIGICNLLALSLNEIRDQLLKYDVIWCFGGNTDYLKFAFDKIGFSAILPQLLKKIIWVGSSAGSCVIGRRHSFTPIEYGITDYLGLVNFCIRPHIWGKYAQGKEKYKYENLLKESHKRAIYALSDKSAVIVDGEKIYLHGKKAQKIESGKITEMI